jgi:hypothetical protein
MSASCLGAYRIGSEIEFTVGLIGLRPGHSSSPYPFALRLPVEGSSNSTSRLAVLGNGNGEHEFLGFGISLNNPPLDTFSTGMRTEKNIMSIRNNH